MVRGAWVISGNCDRVSVKVVDDVVWFSTGNVAKIDADGYGILTDRWKYAINSFGEWISFIDLENTALAHPVYETSPMNRLNASLKRVTSSWTTDRRMDGVPVYEAFPALSDAIARSSIRRKAFAPASNPRSIWGVTAFFMPLWTSSRTSLSSVKAIRAPSFM